MEFTGFPDIKNKVKASPRFFVEGWKWEGRKLEIFTAVNAVLVKHPTLKKLVARLDCGAFYTLVDEGYKLKPEEVEVHLGAELEAEGDTDDGKIIAST